MSASKFFKPTTRYNSGEAAMTEETTNPALERALARAAVLEEESNVRDAMRIAGQLPGRRKHALAVLEIARDLLDWQRPTSPQSSPGVDGSPSARDG